MSKSSKVIYEVGAIQLLGNNSPVLGNTTSVVRSKVPAPSSLGDAAATLTTAQVLSGMLSGTPSVSRALTLPTAEDLVAALPGCVVGESVDFSVLALGTTANANFVVTANTGATIVGNATVGNASAASGSALFKARLTNVTADSEAYVVYRLS